MKFGAAIILYFTTLLSLLLFRVQSALSFNDIVPRNVVLITVDALRADHLGCYGYSKTTSPNIDKLAKEGVLFNQAISQAPYTAASFAASFTSTYPKQNLIIGPNEKLDLCNLTLAEILKKNGYATKAITTNFILSYALGFNQGFEPQEFIEYCKKDETEVAISWLRENKNKRFFLWIHYMDPHAPYERSYSSSFFPDFHYPKPNSIYLPIVESRIGEGGIPDFVVRENRTDLDYYIALYDTEIHRADAKIGRLLEYLDEAKLIDNSLIIFFSDHGEELGEHGYYFSHGPLLYDSSIRVPLIIKHTSLGRNIKIYSQVRLLDISPTVLSFLKLRVPAAMRGENLIHLIKKGIRLNHIAYSYKINKFSLRSKGWKLIYSHNTSNKFELYKLINDPLEKNNLFSVYPPIISAVLKMVILKIFDRIIPGQTPVSSEIKDKNIIEKMKSLGYLE